MIAREGARGRLWEVTDFYSVESAIQHPDDLLFNRKEGLGSEITVAKWKKNASSKL